MRHGLAVGALLLLLAGCSHDGRELAQPDPDLTAVPVPTTAAGGGTVAAVPDASVGADGFAVASPRIQPGKPIPRRFTCKGEDISPPLSFTTVPEGTAQLAVVITDVDADDFVHWAVRGIPPAIQQLGAGQLPEGAVEMTNSYGTTGYRGPCPPIDERHRYLITAYALDANAVELPTNEEGLVDVDAIPSISAASVTGTFGTADRPG